MNLDYLDAVNEYGDNIVRLYDFNMAKSKLFKTLLEDFVESTDDHLDLSKVEFITSRNCSLILAKGEENLGIFTRDKVQFHCVLTQEGYKNMIKLLSPFCLRETSGFQWLYDIDSQTDFLFSPGGTW